MKAKRRCREEHPTATFKAPGVEAPYRCVLEWDHKTAHMAVYGITEQSPDGTALVWDVNHV